MAQTKNNKPDNPGYPVPYHRGLPCPNPMDTDLLALTIARKVHQAVAPAATFLFGSRARGDHNEDTSDIDILLITEETVSETTESLTEREAKNLAATLYGREMKTHLVWIRLAAFDKDQQFINSISTNAMLDGLVLTDHPEYFTTPYASDPPPPPNYEWSGYQYWLKVSRELLVLIKILLDPEQVLWQTIPERYADTIDGIPDMTKKHREDVIRHNTTEVVNTALKAAIEATGGFSKIFAPTHKLTAVLQKELRKQNIDADIPPAIQCCPQPYQDLPMPTAAVQAITDTEAVRQIAIRVRRTINRRAQNCKQETQRPTGIAQ